eukprot:1363441-Rhodomonas_salina.1
MSVPGSASRAPAYDNVLARCVPTHCLIHAFSEPAQTISGPRVSALASADAVHCKTKCMEPHFCRGQTLRVLELDLEAERRRDEICRSAPQIAATVTANGSAVSRNGGRPAASGTRNGTRSLTCRAAMSAHAA